jgi:hypothetical protein
MTQTVKVTRPRVIGLQKTTPEDIDAEPFMLRERSAEKWLITMQGSRPVPKVLHRKRAILMRGTEAGPRHKSRDVSATQQTLSFRAFSFFLCLSCPQSFIICAIETARSVQCV